jgi:hypothetical protein
LESPPPATIPAPAVVVSICSDITLDALQKTFSRFEADDDVFNHHYVEGGYLIVQQSPKSSPNPSLPSDVTDYLNTRSTKILVLDDRLPEGPYFALGRHLHQAWRLFPDDLAAFSKAVIPLDNERAINETKDAPVYVLQP